MLSDFVLVMISFVVALLLGAICTWLVRYRVVAAGIGQTVRSDGPQSHLKKSGTPTLGGVGILAALALMTGLLYWLRGHELDPGVPLTLGLALLYGAIGFADDWSKLRYKRSLGLKARLRLPLEIILAGVFAFLLVRFAVITPTGGHTAQILHFGAGLPWIVFCMIFIAGSANAVNLTDGLDGLAAGVSCFCAIALAAACWLTGQNDLALFAAALAGVAAGFVWLNAHPASIWMGDVGSLGLGAALCGLAVAARLEIMFILFGIIFFVEAVSVMMQVSYFRLTHGKRIFRMAPFHHHLELGGMAETKIVTRFWLVTITAGTVGIALVAWLMQGMFPG